MLDFNSIIFWAITGLSFLSGCHHTPAHDPRQIVAVHTPGPPQLNGQLDEGIWQKTPAYPLGLSQDLTGQGQRLQEGGWVKFLWDADHLYLGMYFEDRAIIATGREDHLFHFEMGDTCEIFLKPATANHYWEMYATPTGKKTCLFFAQPRKQGGRPTLIKEIDWQAAAKFIGTLNQNEDTDQGWTMEIALPMKNFIHPGEFWGAGSDWRIFIARYNYWAVPPNANPEISGALPLSRTDHHLIDEYVPLKLKP